MSPSSHEPRNLFFCYLFFICFFNQAYMGFFLIHSNLGRKVQILISEFPNLLLTKSTALFFLNYLCILNKRRLGFWPFLGAEKGVVWLIILETNSPKSS